MHASIISKCADGRRLLVMGGGWEHVPAMTAVAGLVPWAEVGMMQTSRWFSPRVSWYFLMHSRPAYSP